MDLVDNPALLQVRRDGALQWLVTNDLLRPDAVAAAMRARSLRPTVAGGTAFTEEVIAQVRRRFGFFEPNPVWVRTALDRDLQARLDRWEGLRDGAWVVLDARSGAVQAAGGDLFGPKPTGDLPSILPVVTTERLSLVELVAVASALVREGVPVAPRWYQEVRMEGPEGTLLGEPEGTPHLRLLPAVDARTALDRLPKVGRWREVPLGRTRLLVSADQIVALRPSPDRPRGEPFEFLEVLMGEGAPAASASEPGSDAEPSQPTAASDGTDPGDEDDAASREVHPVTRGAKPAP
jgi:hypothetical protein